MLSLSTSLLLILLIASCSTSVRCPQSRPSKQFALIDHGRHASLVLPVKDGKLIRYVYGDWSYYALNDTSLLSGIKALLWPTESAIGMMSLPGPISKKNITEQLKVGIENSYILNAHPEAIRKLNQSLNALFLKHSDKMIYNSKYDLNFVPLGRAYWIFNNSNQKTASWIEELGCEVKGLTLSSSWRVLDP